MVQWPTESQIRTQSKWDLFLPEYDHYLRLPLACTRLMAILHFYFGMHVAWFNTLTSMVKRCSDNCSFFLIVQNTINCICFNCKFCQLWVHSMIRFLVIKSCKATDIYWQLHEVNGNNVMSEIEWASGGVYLKMVEQLFMMKKRNGK